MTEQNELIQQSIIRDMSEGVMVIGLRGTIQYVNPAALDILENHLLMKDYDIQDEEELETVQLALLIWERCKEENGHAD